MKQIAKFLLWRLCRGQAGLQWGANVSLDTRLGANVRIFKGTSVGACDIGRHSYVAQNCSIERTTIGPFSSIAPGVLCGLGEHPTDFVSTYPGFYSADASGSHFFGTVHEAREYQRVMMGADVWVGANAIIRGGVTIGAGAIVGAGAVVTKDVEPYAIVVGSPARTVRYRFPEETCRRLLATKWWELSDSSLQRLAPYMADVSQFLTNLESLNR